MSVPRLTPAAAVDVAEILNYLTETAGWSYSNDVEQQLYAAFVRLAAFPGIGHLRQDLSDRPYLFYSLRPYIIMYERDESLVIIHAVLQSARNIRLILENR